MANTPSMKRIMIDKANARVVTYVGIAAFILVFSLVATKTLVNQAAYQNRVISAKRTTVKQLKTNIAATDQLKTAYDAFTGTAQNVLGGNSDGSGAKDGNNAKVVLDALPSSYDFPGLTTSLESLLQSQNVKLTSITGTDDEANQAANQSSSSPQPVPMPFDVSITSDYAGVQRVVTAFGQSIRPLSIQQLDLSGSQGQLTLSLTAQTYYQPAKALTITQKAVK